MGAMLEMGLHQGVIHKLIVGTSQLDEFPIALLSGYGLGTEEGIVGIFLDQWIGFAQGVVAITGPRVLFWMLDDPGTDGVAFDVAAGFEEVALSSHQVSTSIEYSPVRIN